MEGDPLTNAIRLNAQIVSEELKESKPILQDAVKTGGVQIVSAYYKLSTGEVEFT
jgi:carbonic anhydrase